MRMLLTTTAALLAVMGPAPASALSILPPVIIACDQAPFTRDATHETLEAHFGKENVTFETVPGPEGTENQATVIFGSDPMKRIEVLWWEQEKRAMIANVSVAAMYDDSGAALPGPYGVLGAQGTALGMGIAEVEKLNGKPFALFGFDWDYAGFVTDFRGGALDGEAGKCNNQVRFTPAPLAPDVTEVPENYPGGEGPFESNSEAMLAVKPTVTELGIGYASPEFYGKPVE